MLTEDIRIQLVRTIAEDLGVPERAQVYYTK